MSNGRARQLWSKALSGEALHPAEEADLLALLDADEELRSDFLRDAKTHNLLGALLRGMPDPEADVRQFLERVAAENEASGFVQRVEARLRRTWRGRFRTRRRAAGGDPWGPLFLAAGLLVGLSLLFGAVLSGPASSAPPREQAAREAAAPAPEPPPEEASPEPDAPAAPPVPPPPPAPAEETPEPEPEPPPVPRESAPREPPPLPPAVPLPPAPTRPETREAAARLLKAQGVRSMGMLLAEGEELFAGQALEIETAGTAVFAYPDRTRVEAEGGTVLALETSPGKRLRVLRGRLNAEVSKQPAGQEMVFSTPHGDAIVVGTRLRLTVDPDPRVGTKLEVLEGTVRLRAPSGRKADVPGGHFAVAAAGVEPAARIFPVDDILLVPRAGKRVGRDWTLAEDPLSTSGMVLEAPEVRKGGESQERLRAGALGFVEFSFVAEAQKDYYVWIRGAARTFRDERHDGVALDVLTGRFAAPCAIFGSRNPTLYFFTGYCHSNGFMWSGGLADPVEGKVGGFSVRTRGDDLPARVRFARSGPQKLRLYPIETPMKVDSIWLSSSQKARPDGACGGPIIIGR